VTVKEAALLLAPRQPCSKDMTGDHASMLRRPQSGFPSEAGPLRKRAALSREPWLELWQREAAAAPAKTLP